MTGDALAGGRRLVINADDFGLADGIDRGILRAHRAGIVTSTSVVAVGRSVTTSARRLADCPDLGIGVHLTAVGEDPPLLSRREVPTLLDRGGRLPTSWRAFLVASAAGRIDPDDLAREFDAQVEFLTRDLELPVAHADCHQHLHLWPPVAGVVSALARRRGIPTVRLPTSRAWGPRGIGIRRLSRALAVRLRDAGLDHPIDHGGLDEAGGLTADRLRALLGQLAAGGARSVEITCHPGLPTPADRARFRWGYRWEDEVAALTDPLVRAVLEQHGFVLSTHGSTAVASRGEDRS